MNTMKMKMRTSPASHSICLSARVPGAARCRARTQMTTSPLLPNDHLRASSHGVFSLGADRSSCNTRTKSIPMCFGANVVLGVIRCEHGMRLWRCRLLCMKGSWGSGGMEEGSLCEGVRLMWLMKLLQYTEIMFLIDWLMMGRRGGMAPGGVGDRCAED